MSDNCTNCGKTAHESDNFCANCGHPAKETAMPLPIVPETKYQQALDRLEARLGDYPTKQIESKWLYTFGFVTLFISAAQMLIGLFGRLFFDYTFLRVIFDLLYLSLNALPLLVCIVLPNSTKRNRLLIPALGLALFACYYIFF